MRAIAVLTTLTLLLALAAPPAAAEPGEMEGFFIGSATQTEDVVCATEPTGVGLGGACLDPDTGPYYLQVFERLLPFQPTNPTPPPGLGWRYVPFKYLVHEGADPTAVCLEGSHSANRMVLDVPSTCTDPRLIVAAGGDATYGRVLLIAR